MKTHAIVSGYLQKSLTMKIYNQLFHSMKEEHEYIPVEIPRIDGQPDSKSLADFVNMVRSTNEYSTLVVSDPYKRIIRNYINTSTQRAQNVGAVNLIYKKDSEIIGDNIDGEAFILGITKETDIDFKDQEIFFFGCGGVSSAIAVALLPHVSKIGLVANHKENAEILRNRLHKLRRDIPIKTYDITESLDLRQYSIIYNGTGLGKFSYDTEALTKTPIKAMDILPENGWAFDANYTPWKTQFLIQCENRMKIHNGFSHMVGFTSLHMSKIFGTEISYERVKKIAEQNITKPI